MNKKAILEIGRITRVTKDWKFKNLKPEEIIECYEFKRFRKLYPELVKLALNKQLSLNEKESGKNG